MTDIDLSDPSSYEFWTDEHVRFSDTDLVGHVNNVAHVALVETGRIRFIKATLERLELPFNSVAFARLEIDFRAELHYPDRVKVGARLLSAGRRSYVIGVGVFAGDRCISTSRNVMVYLGPDGRPAPLPEILRQAIDTSSATGTKA